VATDNKTNRPEVFEEESVSLNPLQGKKVAILGYGSQGRAQSLNLRESGIEVVVGARSRSLTGARAVEDGMAVLSVSDAAAAGDIVVFLVPDEAMAGLYEKWVAPNLKSDACLAFAHGFALVFEQIVPDPDRACFLVAPKGQGDMLREAYQRGGGLPSLIAVTDDSHADTWNLAAAYAKAIGCLKGGGFPTTFREECISDQFGEQVVLCGGVVELLQAAFNLLTERGYAAENAYFECVHELKLIADLLHRYGLEGMRKRISRTAAFGGLTRGPRVIDRKVRTRMARILDEIESGTFAEEFLTKYSDPAIGILPLAAREAESPLARTGRALHQRLEALNLDNRNNGRSQDER